MPSIEDLVVHLAGVHVTDKNKSRDYTVAGHLVTYVLQDRAHGMSEYELKTIYITCGDRLWDSYMQKRRAGMPNEEGAREAIHEELEILQRKYGVNQTKNSSWGILR